MKHIKPNDRTSLAQDAWSVRRVLLHATLSGIVCCTALQQSQVCAQQPVLYGTPQPAGTTQQSLQAAKTLSLRKRVEMLQGNVKRKLQSALGVDPNATAGPRDDADAHWIQGRSAVPSQHAPFNMHSPQPTTNHSAQTHYDRVHDSPFDTYVANQETTNQNSYLRDPQPSVPTQSGVPAQQPSTVSQEWIPPQHQTARQQSIARQEVNQLRPVQVVTAENIPASHFPESDLQPVEHRTMRRVQYRQPFAEQTPPLPPPHPNEVSVTQHAADEPIRRWDDMTTAREPSQSGNYQTPVRSRFRTASAPVDNNTPLPRGTVLGEPQLTATQHALRLMEENGDIKARLAMLESENNRLREKLEQSENLLGRSTQAVESANQELETLSATNRELQKQLDGSQQRYNRYLKETDRMLQSIREELDDVLVREISAKGT